MDNSEQKPQINKSEIIHDLYNLNYLLRTLARMIESVPGLPPDVKRLAMGAVANTNNLITKLGGNSKTTDKTSNDKVGGI